MKSILTVGFGVLLSATIYACGLHAFSLQTPNLLSQKNGIGLMYRSSFVEGEHSHNNNDSHHDHSHEGASSNESVEVFYSVSLNGRFMLTKKLQALIAVPINYHTNGSENTHPMGGLGDISAVASYTLAMKDDNKFNYLILTSAGVSLPTGKYDLAHHNEPILHHAQPGTGSFGLISNVNCVMNFNKINGIIEMGYRSNLTNSLGYRFSDRFNSSARFSYQFKKKNVVTLPTMGIYHERSNHHQLNGEYQTNTGGNATFMETIISVGYKRFIFSAEYQILAFENLYGNQGRNKNRINLNFNYIF